MAEIRYPSVQELLEEVIVELRRIQSLPAPSGTGSSAPITITINIFHDDDRKDKKS